MIPRTILHADRAAARRILPTGKRIKTGTRLVAVENVPLRIMVGSQAHVPPSDLDSQSL
jgi:hypothetical protein